MIAGLVPEVGADGKDGSAEATRPNLVRDEAVIFSTSKRSMGTVTSSSVTW